MRLYALAVVAGLAVAAGACSNSTSPASPSGLATGTTASGTDVTGCTQTVVAQEADTINVRDSVTIPFTTATSGRLDVNVDWTRPDSNMGAFVVAAGSCSSAQFAASSCSFLAQSGEDKPHLLSIPDLAAGSYELMLVNFSGYPDEATAAQVVLSSGSSCPTPAASPAASSAARRH